MANMILSVPSEETALQTSSFPKTTLAFIILAVIETISTSYLAADVQISECKGLD